LNVSPLSGNACERKFAFPLPDRTLFGTVCLLSANFPFIHQTVALLRSANGNTTDPPALLIHKVFRRL